MNLRNALAGRDGRRGQFWLCALAMILGLASCSASTDNEGADASRRDVSRQDASTPDASSQKSRRIYATVASSHEVLVIDDESHEILGSIPVGMGPAILLSTPDESKLYTANWMDSTVSAIDVATEQVTNIEVPNRPYVIAMAPDGNSVYVGLASNQLAVIDTESDTVDRFFEMEELPASVIASPDGDTVYIAMLSFATGGNGRLFAISASTGDIIHEPLEVGLIPAWITITPDGSKVYALNFLSDDVSVIDTASWTLEATVATGLGTQGIIGNVTPDGSMLYVTNHGSGDMVAIDTESNQITKTISLGGRPVGVQFNKEGSRVYVTDFGPESLDIAPDLTYLLTGEFTGTGDGQISVFDEASGELIEPRVSAPPGPTSIVVIDVM